MAASMAVAAEAAVAAVVEGIAPAAAHSGPHQIVERSPVEGLAVAAEY